MSIVKTATAHWEGDLKTGKGQISTESGALKNNPYGFNTRFEGVAGTNPEELIGAAHAGCYSMALSLILGEAGMKADAIDTKCSISFAKVDDKFTITRSHLDVSIKVAGGDKAKIEECAQKAKAGCPISRVLNTEITMTATISV